MEIQLIDPRSEVAKASFVLRDAWAPPCLRYTPDYLAWQFAFPGGHEPVGVLASDGGEPVGFFAAIPRQMRWREHSFPAYLLSFLAVRRNWRGPIVTGLYRVLLDSLSKQDCPVITFAEQDTIAEQLIQRNFIAAGYRHRKLGPCRTFGFMPSARRPESNAVARETTDEAFLSCVAACQDDSVLWNHPSAEQVRHYRTDPRGRYFLEVRDAEGEALAAAMAVRSEVLTATGPHDLAMLDTVYLKKPESAGLAALLAGTSRCLQDRCSSPVITVPNLSGVNPALVRLAGLRETPSCFHSHLFVRNAMPEILDAETTNLEVV